jgi:hypothetical protein
MILFLFRVPIVNYVYIVETPQIIQVSRAGREISCYANYKQ